jgi:hypothetical protein
MLRRVGYPEGQVAKSRLSGVASVRAVGRVPRVVGLGYVLATVAMAAAGCAGPDRDPPAAAAVRFASALIRGDGAAACSMLNGKARSSVSGATDMPCAKAIVSVQEKGQHVTSTQVWGDAAQVRIGGDVMFLRLISGRWRVSAAGCEPQHGGRYECTVGG